MEGIKTHRMDIWSWIIRQFDVVTKGIFVCLFISPSNLRNEVKLMAFIDIKYYASYARCFGILLTVVTQKMFLF